MRSSERPLWRRRIVVTRPRSRAASWVEAFAQAGADVVIAPTIVLGTPDAAARTAIEDQLAEAPDPVWIAVTSPSSAQAIADLFDASHRLELRSPRFHWAAVGVQTQKTLELRGVEVQVVASAPDSAALATSLLDAARERGDAPPFVFHATSTKGRPDFLERIVASGGAGDRLLVTVNRPNPDFDPSRIGRELQFGGIDALTFASPSAAEVFADRTREAGLWDDLRALPAIAAGATTARALESLSFDDITTSASPAATDVVRACAERLSTSSPSNSTR